MIELYLGARTPAAALEAAPQPLDRCAAQFFIGEWHILKGHTADAEAALKATIENCRRDLRWRIYALAELRRLKP